MDNTQRAAKALDAASDYLEEDVEQAISDLLCDLHHLADVNDLDWEVLIDRGDMHYVAEVEEEA
jgi:hypothetical protein